MNYQMSGLDIQSCIFQLFVTCYFLIFTEDTCDILPSLDFTSVNTSLVVVGTYVNVSCAVGYMFPGRFLYKIVYCLESMLWNDTLTDCIGKYGRIFC